MADEKPTLHVDSDWKRQAQEEKQRLIEEERKRQAAQAPQPQASAAGPQAPEIGGEPGRRQLPPASFGALVQTLLTQTLYYLGDLATRTGGSSVNLDMAKHQIDTMAVLEEKTRGNLSDDEKRLLDTALYEARMRYVSVAQQFLGP